MLRFRRRRSLWQLLLWLGCSASGGLSVAAPQVFILHSPIQPGADQSVKYTATASDPSGITSIVIEEQPLSCNAEGCSIVIPTNVHTCPPTSSQTSATCTVAINSGYSDGSLIAYRAIATNGASPRQTTTDGYIYFAVGAFPDPIPVYFRGDQTEKVDLVFIPDKTDYVDNAGVADNTGFMNDVETLIRDSFLSDKPFSSEIRNRREMWNFYITYQQGDAEPPNPGCNLDPPPNWTMLRATVNTGFIVHKADFRDCSGRGEGSIFSAERVLPPTDPNYRESFRVVPIHEVGHAVFSLADEYAGGGLFDSTLPEHNVFSTRRPACVNNASAHGWPESDCNKIRRASWYRSDKAPDIMEDTSSVNNGLGRSGEGRSGWHYDQCANHNC